MNRQTKAVLGAALVLLGAYMMLQHGRSVGPGFIFGHFWPSLFVLPLAFFFHWLYFSMLQRRGVGLLIPGGILLGAGLVCQVSSLFNTWGSMWPGFILSVAFGLWEFYWFGSRNRWMLIPINILLVLGLLFSSVFSISALLNGSLFSYPLITLLFIAAGSYLLLSRNRA